MAPSRPGAQRLDRDVYQIVRKLEDETEARGHPATKFTIAGVYDSIKRSNSSLAREKKRPLEESIERVLRLRKEERAEEDEDQAMEDAAAVEPKPKERDYFLLNKQITKSWNVARRERPSSPDGTTTGKSTPAETTVDSAIVMADRQPNGEPKPKRRKAERQKEDRNPPAGVSLEDLGGMESAIWQLIRDVERPMLRPGDFLATGATPVRGVLLHGPPGCGKTMLANAFAAMLGVSFIPVSAPSLIAGMSGESEKKIRELYEEAKSLAPCLIFIDEIDAIMGKRDNAQREMEKRIVAQMLTCMDDLSLEKTGGKPVITLAATNRPDSIDPALRRAGRFNREINIGVPNELARAQILKTLLRKRSVSDDVDLKALARLTPGFVGADLEDVLSVATADMLERSTDELIAQAMAEMDAEVTEQDDDINADSRRAIRAAMAIKATVDQPISENALRITHQDLVNAVSKVQPSAKREGFTTIPDTTWAQVGALGRVREELNLAIIRPIDTPERFAKVGWRSPSGVLLWGPPGCGKTLLAKAVANEAKANFISVKGPELLNKYVGESERSIRQVFSRARASAPCILFFDELDALVPRRSGDIAESSARVVNMLLTELDGMDSRAGVYVIGATNRPDMIDPAILRPGRLGTRIFVDLPDEDGRVDILQTKIKNALPLSTPEELAALDPIARDRRCNMFSGADLENLHIAAAKASVKRTDAAAGNEGITAADWEVALEKIKPSVSESVYKRFQKLKGGWE